MLQNNSLAPELITSDWLNTDAPVSLQDLRGRIILLYCFQMLCPACVSHGLPQAIAVRNTFSHKDVVVIGLHTVFEHHQAMGKLALQAFIHEYRIRFPIAIDMPNQISGIPLSMQKYGLRGTPSLLLIDHHGLIRLHHFGHLDDMKLGSIIGQLIAEKADTAMAAGGDHPPATNNRNSRIQPDCDQHSCPSP